MRKPEFKVRKVFYDFTIGRYCVIYVTGNERNYKQLPKSVVNQLSADMLDKLLKEKEKYEK